MKLTAIRGENLASLKAPFEIDFNQQPLADAGLYAITGSTGAGKSTILDAVCLALFNNAPRTNQSGESQTLPDVGKETIKANDSRTILRRGASGGYAEVDFTTISGEQYRARWSVRRSRDKTDGTLQASEISLMNITKNREEQGTRTKLLQKISSLIGLTYDQFTRSVLLAQGDFATFLKAKDNEKAELLEKITGTEIYSEISVKIYNKNKAVNAEHTRLMTNKDEIELLTNEEVKQYEEESNNLISKEKNIRSEIERIDAKKRWFELYNSLNNDVKIGKQQVISDETDWESAQPKVQKIAQIALVDEIKVDFLDWEKSKQDLLKTDNNLTTVNKRITAWENERKVPEKMLINVEQKRVECNIQFDKIQHDISKASALDAVISEMKTAQKLQQNELLQLQESVKKLTKMVNNGEQNVLNCHQTMERNNAWFEKYNSTESIIADVNIICLKLDELQLTLDNQETVKKEVKRLLAKSEKTQLGLEKKLNQQQKLAQLLPTEIATLRKQLIENEPCPVCGGVHHPYAGNVVQSSVETNELEQQKKQVATELDALQQQYQQTNTLLTAAQTNLQSLHKQQQTTLTVLEQKLKVLPRWQETFSIKGKLQQQLKNLQKQWNEKQQQKNQIVADLGTIQTKLTADSEQLKLQHEQQNLKKATYEKHLHRLETKKNERKALLGGKTVEETEVEYKKSIAEMERTMKKLKSEIDTLANKISGGCGQITQLTKQKKGLQTEINNKNNMLQHWFIAKKITEQQVSELVHTDRQWVDSEQKAINQLQEKLSESKSVLQERTAKLNNHNHSKTTLGITKDDTIDTLLQIKSALNKQLATNAERIAQIKAIIILNEQNRKKQEKLQRQIENISERLENWGKLNTLFGSSKGDKFKKAAQSYTLDALLVYANFQLQNLTSRYLLERLPDTLGLQIVDTEMLNERRSVHSLSGGETFLVALALALGLSSVSAQNIRIETMFIDEGFGSLDKETLAVAVDALENLQSQGRKIGVITHVAEMVERIAVQIRVEKASGGKSNVSVMGS